MTTDQKWSIAIDLLIEFRRTKLMQFAQSFLAEYGADNLRLEDGFVDFVEQEIAVAAKSRSLLGQFPDADAVKINFLRSA